MSTDTRERRVARLEKTGGGPCPECARRAAAPPRLILPVGEPDGPTTFFDWHSGAKLDPAEVEAPKRCPGCGCTVEPAMLDFPSAVESDLRL